MVYRVTPTVFIGLFLDKNREPFQEYIDFHNRKILFSEIIPTETSWYPVRIHFLTYSPKNIYKFYAYITLTDEIQWILSR